MLLLLPYTRIASPQPPFLSAAPRTTCSCGSCGPKQTASLAIRQLTSSPYVPSSFPLKADPPNPDLIPPEDLLGVTVVLITCSYKEKEFIRVGYYVNNGYDDQALQEDPPPKPVYDRIVRNVLAEKPRVTRFNIDWD